MIEVEVKFREVTEALQRLQRAGRNLAPAFKAARGPLRRDLLSHKREQQGPDGRWPKRADATDLRRRARSRTSGRKRKGGTTLGRLPGEANISFSRNRLVAFSRLLYSGVHQEGAGRTGRAPKIPKRTYLWVSRMFLNELAGIIERTVVAEWKR